ncbi:MAG TPA: HAD family hydrolase [Pseudomonadales bacterium]|nr:HAD family hydrolase [Pseudomonadales bacterium]
MAPAPAPALELVVFDCDGVLVDSEAIACLCFAEALAAIGIERSPAELDAAFRGRRLDECLVEVEGWLGRPLPRSFEGRLRAATGERLRRDLLPVAGIHAAIDAIRTRFDVPVCVASSSEPDRIALSLATTGLDHHFRGRIFSATQVPRGKPAPDLFLHAARCLGADPAACAVIEDSPAGMRAGVAAGMRVFAYLADGHDLSTELASTCTPFRRMDALPALLAAFRRAQGPAASTEGGAGGTLGPDTPASGALS